MSGWIKMHRQMLDTPELKRGDAKAIWLVLLLKAAHRPTLLLWGNKTVHLERGQLAISVNKLASDEGFSRRRVRAILANYMSAGMIETRQAQGQAFTLVTICNYDAYQSPTAGDGQVIGQAWAKLGPTEQEREEGKEGIDSSLRSESSPRKDARRVQRASRLPSDWAPSAEQADYARALALEPNRVAADFRDYWIAKPGQGGLKLDWNATWQGWCRREADRQAGQHRRTQGGPSVVTAAANVLRRMERANQDHERFGSDADGDPFARRRAS